MPAIYYRHGMRFMYPENWTLEESDPIIRGASWTDYALTITSPGGGFWSVVRYAPGTNPEKYLNALLQTMQEEYQDVDVDLHSSLMEGRDVTGYDLNFFCLDLTNTALIRGISTPHATWVVYCQAEDREFAQIGEVFRAMTTSLIRGETEGRQAEAEE